jgi:hypothetical protein
LTDASYDDDLTEWQGLEVYDASGRRYTAHRVYRAWPSTRLGVWVCRLANNCIHVEMDLVCDGPAALDELKHRIARAQGDTSELMAAVTHRKAIELCL